MSEREWKPGDVAMLTFNNASLAQAQKGETEIVTVIGLRREDDWALDSYGCAISEEQALEITARPLVVIDPEDRQAVRRLRDLLEEKTGDRSLDLGPVGRAMVVQDALREFACPIPTGPVGPSEPEGLGAVVEDGSGSRYIRVSDHKYPWMACGGNARFAWREIDNVVRVLSHGVTGEDQ